MRLQRGLSLIELMISMTISLFLLVGLAGIFANSSRTQNDLTKTARQIEDGRFATTVLATDLGLAGYYGYYYWTPAASTVAATDPCVTDNMTTLTSGLGMAVQGYNDASSSPLSCIAAADHLAGTDILVIRRADTQVAGTLAANDVYLQSNGNPESNPIVNTGGSGALTLTMRNPATIAPSRKLHVLIYYISPCSVPASGVATDPCTSAADGGSPIPTLKRKELALNAGTLSFVTVPLVEGVENMQIDYGVDTTSDGTQDEWVADPSTAERWANVVSVRVSLLVRNVESTAGYTDTKTYNLGLAGNVTPGGAYKRHVYQTMVRLVNPSARRETP